MRIGSEYRYRVLSGLGLLDEVCDTDSVLDIGGYDGYLLSTINCRRRVVVDPCAVAVHPHVEYVQLNILDHPLHELFDFIFSLDVIEHLPVGTEELYMARIVQHLKPGGKAAITVPSADIRITPSWLQPLVSRMWNHRKCPGYTKTELKRLAETTRRPFHVTELNAPAFRRGYLPLRAAKPFLPALTVSYAVARMATYDIKHNKGQHGYFLLTGRRPE